MNKGDKYSVCNKLEFKQNYGNSLTILHLLDCYIYVTLIIININ